MMPLLLIGGAVALVALLATKLSGDRTLALRFEEEKRLPKGSVSPDAPFENVVGPRTVKDSKGRNWDVTTFHNPRGGKGLTVAIFHADPSVWISFFQEEGIRTLYKLNAEPDEKKALLALWNVN